MLTYFKQIKDFPNAPKAPRLESVSELKRRENPRGFKSKSIDGLYLFRSDQAAVANKSRIWIVHRKTVQYLSTYASEGLDAWIASIPPGVPRVSRKHNKPVREVLKRPQGFSNYQQIVALYC